MTTDALDQIDHRLTRLELERLRDEVAELADDNAKLCAQVVEDRETIARLEAKLAAYQAEARAREAAE